MDSISVITNLEKVTIWIINICLEFYLHLRFIISSYFSHAKNIHIRGINKKLAVFKLPPLISHTGEMAFSLLSPPPSSALCSLSSTSSSPAQFTGQSLRLWTSRSRTGPALPVLTRASSEKDDDKPAFNPFGFVTDNPSSRSAIQMPESPAEDGNVGQMLYVTQFSSLY